MPHGLVDLGEHAKFNATDSIVVGEGGAEKLIFPAPTGELAKKTNAQLRKQALELAALLKAFSNDNVAELSSGPNGKDKSAFANWWREITGKQSREYQDRYSNEVYAVSSEIVSRTSMKRPQPSVTDPNSIRLAAGWDVALLKRGSANNAAAFLEFAAAQLVLS